MAEKQPQQNDHWYRHAEQPEQNSFSHIRLLGFLNRRENVRDVKGFRCAMGMVTSVRYWASNSRALRAAWVRPSAAARSSADPASARTPSSHRAADD